MKSNSRPKTLLVMLLCLSLLATGCSAQWIKVALADLPVLLQMALNIGTLVTKLQSGQQLSSSEAAEIQNISNEASRDLNLLQTLYNEYEASPSPNSVQKIQSAITDINQNLPALLQAAHVSDPVLSARITAAVNLILSTVNSFAALIPQAAAPMMAQKVMRKPMTVPKASDLKKQWNQQVCGPTGEAALDSGFAPCEVK
jgi:hypothetical protein